MTVTLAGYRTRVMNRLGVPTGDSFFPPHVLTDAINQALATIEEESYWPWSEVVVNTSISAGSATLVLPDDCRAVKSLYVGGHELAQVSLTDALRWPASTTGLPGVWAPSGNTMVALRPIASGDTDITVVYYRQQDQLVQDTDVAMLPDRFAPAVVSKAAELCARREDDGPAQAMHLADYSSWLTRMRKSLRSTTKPTVPRVRPGSWLDSPV